MKHGRSARQDKPEIEQLPAAENFARIAASAQSIVNAADSILRERGTELGLADWSLLQHLAGARETVRMGRLAVQMGVSRQRIQKQTEALAAAGYVHVQPSDEDKRIRLVALTKWGSDALKAMSAQWTGHLAKHEVLSNIPNLDVLRERVQRIANLLSHVHRRDAQDAAMRR